MIPRTKAIIVPQLKRQEINTLIHLLRCTCEASVFIGQQLRCVRIAVTILCIFWHSVHPPRAVKYITCRVMSFRPWQASNGPLRGLSCLHGGIALIPLFPSCLALLLLSSLPVFLPVCQSLATFYSSVFISVSPSPPPFFLLSFLP